MMESRSRSVLDTPLSRSMTIFARSYLSRAAQRAKAEATKQSTLSFLSLYGSLRGRDEIERRPDGTLTRSQPARS
jgi:uncharacterized protein YfaQ (DUF2300 family)